MRLHAVALTRIEAHWGAFRTHLGAYQFIETRLAGRIRVADLLGFECYGRFSQINNAVGCGRKHTVKFIFAWIIQVEFQSNQPNPVFCPMVRRPYSPRGEHMAINRRLYELYIRHRHTSTVCRTGGRLELFPVDNIFSRIRTDFANLWFLSMLPFIIWNNIFPPYLPVEAVFIRLYLVLIIRSTRRVSRISDARWWKSLSEQISHLSAEVTV
jgi:hypothetical protein